MTDSDAAQATQRLLEVMSRLLGPNGCPWDRQQTHHSLVPYLLEEAYELAEAIDRGLPKKAGEATPDAVKAVKEELGDVLLQVVFHSQLAKQEGSFDFAEVAAGLADKLVERHPHVFAREQLNSADEVSDAWDRRKLAGRESRLDGIPANLPALMLASKTSSRAAKAGFEWGAAGEIYARIQEELEEFKSAMKEQSPDAPRPGPELAADRSVPGDDAEMEFGDLLFCMVQLARWSNINPERALRRASEKFARRFRHMEQSLRSQGRDPSTVSTDEWWALWDAAKREVSNI